MARNGNDAGSGTEFIDDPSASQERSRSAASSGREASRGESRGEGRGESRGEMREDTRDASRGAASDDDMVDEIRQRAYERWVARGEGPGSDLDDWCCAERDVREARESGRRSDGRQDA
jgi:hypothetical protein